MRKRTGLEVIQLVSCSTQLSTQFQPLIKTKIPTYKKLLGLSLSDVEFTMRINEGVTPSSQRPPEY